MEQSEALVVGAGVIGLACARALARRGIGTLIVERHPAIGCETSSRNSEVIHAGLYYPAGSAKAALCVAGRERLYAFCAAHGIAHRRCGKLIVATDPGQHAALRALQAQGTANGVRGLTWLEADAARALEPALACSAALLSPDTGILDSRAFLLALLGDAERHGATLVCRTRFTGARATGNGFVATLVSGGEPLALSCRYLINAAGLAGPATAGTIDGLAAAHVPAAAWAKGNYFALAGRAPFSRLVYPLPEPGGLGVHLTLDLGGQARFGPDVEWVASPEETQVDPARAPRFAAAIRRYWPALPEDALSPAWAGIRPKLGAPGAPASDFRIDGPQTHGLPGLVNCLGIESPGLTASLALAERVCAQLGLGAAPDSP